MEATIEPIVADVVDNYEELGFVHPPVKRPQTRLYDLLAGWSRYAQRDEGNGITDNESVVEAIEDAYQEWGNRDDNSTNPEAIEGQLRDFLVSRVLPILMTGV